jgi:glutamate synthase (NADPH/NADH) small chain
MSAFPFEYQHAKREGIEFHWNTAITRIGTESVHCGNIKIPCDMVIPAIGQSPFKDFGPVNRETGQTRYPKYFAGGDFINGGREVVDAVADGKRAALGIVKWLT